jgi:DNA-binding SARP family transcriptional activator/streptogramin lyase
VEFRVLGPLEVSAAGRPLSLGGRKQRTVLALLLLHANELVPRERLIDALWEEAPPAEAEASLRVYVARLRKLLAAATNGRPILETNANGYILRVEPETLDLERFRRLVAHGDFAEALELWRGPALADLAEEEWARRESGVLEELRLNALEERIDADLAAGQQSDLIAELEMLVDEHPYRERFLRQLMVALYRCGRQPDALRAYVRARDELRERFGLEPTRELKELERQILVQDPALDRLQTPDVEAATSRRGSRFRRGALLAVAVGVVLVLAATMLALAREAPEPTAEAVALKGNSVVGVDPDTGRVLGEVPLGGRPSGLAVGLGSVWVGNVDDETLLRVNPRTRRVVETIGLGAAPTELAVGGGSVWVLSLEANALLQVDPSINQAVETIPLPPIEPFVGASHISQIAFARGSLWLRTWPPTAALMRMDPRTHSITIVRRDVVRISSNGQSLWALLGIEANRVQRLYPPGDVIGLDRVGSIPGLSGLAADERAVWVTSRGGVVPRWAEGTLWRIDPTTGRVISSIVLEHASAGIALGPKAVWIVSIDGYVLRVDPDAERVTRKIALGLYPPNVSGTIVAGAGGVWVATLAR